jgi:type VI secretion system secreted protein Hcp
VGIGKWIGRPSRAVVLVAVGAAGAGAAIAVAAVPDSNGEIHACVELSANNGQPVVGPNLRILDTGASPPQACTTNAAGTPFPPEEPLSWNTTGPQGLQGPPGANGKDGAQGPAGNTLTVSGQTFSLSNGKTLTIAGNPVVAPLPIKPGARPVGAASFGSGPGAPPAIEIDSFSFGASNAGTQATGSGGGAGKANVHEIQITKTVDSASPKLFQACVSGQHYKKVIITLRKAGENPKETITLSDALISSYQQSNGGDKPTESLSLNFTKIELKDTPIDTRGTS